jgi:hypothetical protein
VSNLLETRTYNEFPPEPAGWLWEPYLARGTLAVLDGDPGVGKSFLALDLAARLSRGGPLPDGKPLDRPHVTLFLSAEDAASDTIRPRAEAAGADLTKLVVIAPGYGPLPRFPNELPTLEETVRSHRADLVVLDPFAAFVPPSPAGGGDRPVYRTLSTLADLAARLDCSVLLVRHLTKIGGLRMLYHGLGSVGVVRAVHTGLILGRHPRDPEVRVLARTKPASGPPALGFRPTADTGAHPRLRWLGPVNVSADELYTTRKPAGQRPRERAAEWLRRELANGTRRAAEVIADAAAVGITRRTLVRAKRDLGVRSTRIDEDGMSGWGWSKLDVPT